MAELDRPGMAHDSGPRGDDAPVPVVSTRATPRRILNRLGIFCVAIGSIVGGGWFFAPRDAAELAGPASIISWAVATFMLMTIALVVAELGAMFPVSGGTARFPLYAFGRSGGFVGGWFSLIIAVVIPPVEVIAILRYAADYFPRVVVSHGPAFGVSLTPLGLVIGSLMLVPLTVLNLMGMHWFRQTNAWVVIWKIAVPLALAIALITTAFHGSNISAGGGFAPYGSHGILAGVSQAGALLALFGFEQAVQLGGETRHPQRNIPIAVIASVAVAAALYMLLQIAYVVSVPTQSLSGGWTNETFQGSLGPFYGLTQAAGLTLIGVLVAVNVFVSPAGTALNYVASGSRVPYAMAREGFLPTGVGRLNRRGVPVVSLCVCFVLEVTVLLTVPTSRHLTEFVTTSTCLVYATVALSAGALRRALPERPRPFRLPAWRVVTPVAFVFANFAIYWSGWRATSRVFVGAAIGLAILALVSWLRPSVRHTRHEWRAIAWLAVYIPGMIGISLVGDYGGMALIPGWAAIVLLVGLSIAVFVMAARLGASAHKHPVVQRLVAEANP